MQETLCSNRKHGRCDPKLDFHLFDQLRHPRLRVRIRFGGKGAEEGGEKRKNEGEDARVCPSSGRLPLYGCEAAAEAQAAGLRSALADGGEVIAVVRSVESGLRLDARIKDGVPVTDDAARVQSARRLDALRGPDALVDDRLAREHEVLDSRLKASLLGLKCGVGVVRRVRRAVEVGRRPQEDDAGVVDQSSLVGCEYHAASEVFTTMW